MSPRSRPPVARPSPCRPTSPIPIPSAPSSESRRAARPHRHAGQQRRHLRIRPARSRSRPSTSTSSSTSTCLACCSPRRQRSSTSTPRAEASSTLAPWRPRDCRRRSLQRHQGRGRLSHRSLAKELGPKKIRVNCAESGHGRDRRHPDRGLHRQRIRRSTP